MQVTLLAGYAGAVAPECSHVKATTASLAPLHVKTTARCPSHGNRSAHTAIQGNVCMICCPSKQRKPRSGDTEREEGGSWTISHSNDSAPTAGNRWHLELPSVSPAACSHAHHQWSRQPRVLRERSQAIGRPTGRRQLTSKMIAS